MVTRFHCYDLKNINMRFLTLAGLCILLCIFDVSNAEDKKACYKAKICLHNGNEKCGVDTDGIFRRFIDMCDLLEYNCLKKTEFSKTLMENCNKLPPMSFDETTKQGDVNDIQPSNTTELQE